MRIKNRSMLMFVVVACLSHNVEATEFAIAVDEVVKVAWDQTNRWHVGSNFYDADPVVCRERGNDTEKNLQGVTYIKFNLENIPYEYVNTPSFSATFYAEYRSQFNDINSMAVGMSVVPQQHTWSNVAGEYPMATWVGPPDLGAGGANLLLDINYTLIDDVKTQAPIVTNTVDVTQDIIDWVSGGVTNNGYVVFGTTDTFQGAGFDNVQLIIHGPPMLTDHWALDETSGTSAGNSTGGTNGTITGGVTLDQTGKIGGAFSFNGTDGVVTTVGYKGITGTEARTVSAWIKTTTSTDVRGLISWGQNDAEKAWDFEIGSDKPRFNVNGGFQLGSTTVTDGIWHHVVAIYPGDDGSPNVNDVKLYVDGNEEVISSSLGINLNTVAFLDVAIGLDRNRTKYFSGLIDDVAIWRVGLNDGEVRSLFEMADAPRLNYSVLDVQELWNAYDAGEGQVTVQGRKWKYYEQTGVSAVDGELVDLGGGSLFLVMDATAGTGMLNLPLGTIILIQ